MSNFVVGHAAEKHAAEYLERDGYNIVELNWHTRYCEIDIVAEKDKTVYFFEVKYRKNNSAGSGLEYITMAKQKQMKFAAEMWVQEHDWTDDYTLGAVEVTGPKFKISKLLTEL